MAAAHSVIFAIQRIPKPRNLKGTSEVTQQHIDSNGLRTELRALPRGSLLLIAERAIDLVTHDQLVVLLGDIVQIGVAPSDNSSDDAALIVRTSLLDQVRAFHHAAMLRLCPHGAQALVAFTAAALCRQLRPLARRHGAHRTQILLPQARPIKTKNKTGKTAQTDDAKTMLKFQLAKLGGLEFNLRAGGAEVVTVHAGKKWPVGECFPTQERTNALARWLGKA